MISRAGAAWAASVGACAVWCGWRASSEQSSAVRTGRCIVSTRSDRSQYRYGIPLMDRWMDGSNSNPNPLLHVCVRDVCSIYCSPQLQHGMQGNESGRASWISRSYGSDPIDFSMLIVSDFRCCHACSPFFLETTYNCPLARTINKDSEKTMVSYDFPS